MDRPVRYLAPVLLGPEVGDRRIVNKTFKTYEEALKACQDFDDYVRRHRSIPHEDQD
jgi:hypothetical protein